MAEINGFPDPSNTEGCPRSASPDVLQGVLEVTYGSSPLMIVVWYSLLGISNVMGIFALMYGLFQAKVMTINPLLLSIVAIYFVIGVLIVLINVPATTAMMRIIDKDKFGKVSSVTNIGSQGLTPIAVLLGGVALEYMGSLGLLIICGAGFLVSALVLFFAPSIREI